LTLYWNKKKIDLLKLTQQLELNKKNLEHQKLKLDFLEENQTSGLTIDLSTLSSEVIEKRDELEALKGLIQNEENERKRLIKEKETQLMDYEKNIQNQREVFTINQGCNV